MPSFRDGQYNLSGLTNPGVYIGIVPPTPFVNGVPSNIEATVGVGSWGPVNAVAAFNDPDGCTAFYGPPQVRYGDIATHVAAACQEGKAIAFRGVRVTDGTDVAATAAVPGSAGTFTARHTGTVGNRISAVFQPSAAAGSYSCIVTFPGRTPERFDNILPAVQSLTVVAGSGYTSVPAIAMAGPQRAGGIPAAARASLVAVGTPVVAAGGTNYVVGDKITLPNGVVVTVATVTSGAVATVTLTTPGLITSGAAPTNPVSQASTTGMGAGATFTVGYGLGPATITAGSGYTSAPTLTLSGGGGGTGGSYTPIVSFYAGLAAAINNGTTQRGRSLAVVYTPGTSTAAPTLGTPIVLSGGTDGAGGVGTAQQVGVDALPRTGMYALRGTGADTFALCDSTDSSAWGAMLAFAISENMLAVATTASGDSIAGAVAARIAAGVDDTNFKLIAGDWPTFYDSVNGPRLVSPTAIYQGLVGNLSPEQSPINKPLVGVTATQGSQTGVLISDTDEATAQTGGIDIIGRASALGADYFSFLTGRNTSSNTAANGDEYTRLTANLVRALQGAATRSIVGRLQSVRADDPTRIKAKAAIDSYLQSLVDPQSGSDGYGMIDQFATVCDQSNNTPTTVARGFLFLYAKVRYLNAVRYFVIKLAGGGNVTVTSQATQPTIGTQLAA